MQVGDRVKVIECDGSRRKIGFTGTIIAIRNNHECNWGVKFDTGEVGGHNLGGRLGEGERGWWFYRYEIETIVKTCECNNCIKCIRESVRF